jgi:hypothetical protein
MDTHSFLIAAVELRDLSEGGCFWFVFLLLALKLLWNVGLFFEMWYHAWKRDSKQDASYSFHPHIELLLLFALVFSSPGVHTFVGLNHWQVFKYGFGAILLSYAPILVPAVVAHVYVWVVRKFR